MNDWKQYVPKIGFKQNLVQKKQKQKNNNNI